MSDFKSAFNKGIQAAEAADAANKEIDLVFQDLNKQLAEATVGKLTIRRQLLERPRERSLEQYLPPSGPFEAWLPPDTYWALVAVNPKIESSYDELCEWDSDSAGYPCTLTWGFEKHYCENKQSLEDTLSELLRDPIISRKMLTLMNAKPKNR